MFSVFMMVFSLLSILSATFAYHMAYGQMFLIAVGCCLVQRIVFSNKKRFLIFLGILLIGTMLGITYIEYYNLWDGVKTELLDFVMTYVYSVRLTDYYIGGFHQKALMVIIGLMAAEFYWVLYKFRYTFFIPLGIHLIILFLANRAGLLITYYDFGAFFIYLVGAFVYLYDFFVEDYLHIPTGALKRSAIVLTVIFGLSVSIAGLGLHNFHKNPFIKVKEGNVGGVTYELVEPDTDYEILVKSQMRSNEYTLQNSFEHEGLELFVVRTDKIDRLYTQTFSTYDNGRWINTEALDDIQDYETVITDISPEPLESADLFHQESIQVSYRRLQTNMLLRPEIMQDLYLIDSDSEHESTTFYEMPDSAYELVEEGESDENEVSNYLGYGFMYNLTAYLPKYGTQEFNRFLNDLGNQEISITDDFNDLFAAFPEGMDQIRELTLSIVPENATRMEASEAVSDYLKANFTYNEEPNLPEGPEQIHAFLFDVQEGFCQQFATSMALMLRSIGIPTRFVVGYTIDTTLFDDLPEELIYGPEAGVDDSIHVYDTNAHTWVQVFYPGYGWIDYEPTPGIVVTEFVDPSEVDTEMDIDAIDTENRGESSSYTMIWYAIVVAGIVLLSILVVWVIRRRLYRTPLQRFKQMHLLIVMYLEAYGVARKPGETLREYGNRVDQLVRIPGQQYDSFIAPLEEVFYNEEAPDEQIFAAMQLYLKEVKTLVKRMMTTFAYRRIVIKELVSRLRKK